MKKNILKAVLLILFIYGCHESKTKIKDEPIAENTKQFDELFIQKSTLNLDTDEFLYSGNGKIKFINEDTLAVIDKSQGKAYLINRNRHKLFEFGTIGKGPFELLSFSDIGNDQNTLYLYSAVNGKVVAFNKQGKPINENINFPMSSSFLTSTDSHASFYFYSTLVKGDQKIIAIFDNNGNKIIEFGNPPDYLKLLAAGLNGGGGFAIYEGNLYQAFAGEYGINKYDLASGQFIEHIGKQPPEFKGITDVIKVYGDDTRIETIRRMTQIINLFVLTSNQKPYLMLQYLIQKDNDLIYMTDIYDINGHPFRIGLKQSKKFVKSVYQNMILIQNMNEVPYKYEVYEVAF